MIQLVSTPQVLAAIVAGIFSIFCKLLERSKRDSDGATFQSSPRGFLGNWTVIMALAAVLFASYSIWISHRQMHPGVSIIAEKDLAIDPKNETATEEFVIADPGLLLVTGRSLSGHHTKVEEHNVFNQLYVTVDDVAIGYNRDYASAITTSGFQASACGIILLKAGKHTIKVKRTLMNMTEERDFHLTFVVLKTEGL